MRDPWENIPEGEEMATDLAQMKYLEKKAGRIISEWLRMSAAGQRPLAGFPYFKTDQKPKN